MIRPVIAVTFLVLVACSTERSSDGSTSEERDAYAAALAANWGLDGNSGFVLIGRRATCVAERWVDVIGAGRLRDDGVRPRDLDPRRGGAFRPVDFELTEEQARTMVDAFSTCDADLVELFVTARAEGLGEDARTCLRDELTPELARAVVESSLRFERAPAGLLDQLAELSDACG